MNPILPRLKKHYLPSVFVILVVGLILHLAWPNKDTVTYITDSTGYIAIVVLVLSLIIGPINLLLKRCNPYTNNFRRDIGIVGGLLAVIHSVTGLFVHLRGNNWQYFLTKSDLGYAIRLDDFGLANYFGLISTLLIILLLITSNDYSIRKLGVVKWKNLQRFSYFMFIFALVHCIYYRIVMNNLMLTFSLYLPAFLVVLIFQKTGVSIKLRERKRKMEATS